MVPVGAQSAPGRIGNAERVTHTGALAPQPPPRLYAESARRMPLGNAPREGGGAQRPASQETCHGDMKPTRRGDGQRRTDTCISNPALIDGAKMALVLRHRRPSPARYGAEARLARRSRTSGAGRFAARGLIATGAVLAFFQLLPHPPVGVSEVHLILGSTLFLTLGAGARRDRPRARPAAAGPRLRAVRPAAILRQPDDAAGAAVTRWPRLPRRIVAPGHGLRRSELRAGRQAFGHLPGRHRRLGGLLGLLRARASRPGKRLRPSAPPTCSSC